MDDKQTRPLLKLKPTPLETVLDAAALGLLILMGLYVANAWESLPEQIPLHFGPSGTPDNWGVKAAIWLLPLLGLVMFGALKAMRRFPHTFNYPFPITEENAENQYRLALLMTAWLVLWVELVFGIITWAQVHISLGQMTGLGLEYMGPVMVGLFVTIAYYMYRMYRMR